jgi:hypothetical protein
MTPCQNVRRLPADGHLIAVTGARQTPPAEDLVSNGMVSQATRRPLDDHLARAYGERKQTSKLRTTKLFPSDIVRSRLDRIRHSQ